LLDVNGRRKLFGIKSDNRAIKASEDQLELFSLGATTEDIAQSVQDLLKEVSRQQEKATEEKKHAYRTATRMVLPETLKRSQ